MRLRLMILLGDRLRRTWQEIIPMFGFEYCKMPVSSFVNFKTQPYNVLTEEHHL